MDFPVPKDRTHLRQFNGLVNCHHRHLKNVPRIQGSLNTLTSTKVPLKWTQVQQKSFDKVRKALAEALWLYVPISIQSFFFIQTLAILG